jgi:AraC-like DNA-binding protein
VDLSGSPANPLRDRHPAATVGRMVRSGLLSANTSGQPSALGWTGIETNTLHEIAADPARPILLDHHALFLVTVGHGTHEVDFHPYQCRPGTLIRARPGQAIRYGGQPSLDAVLVNWDATILAGLGPTGDVDDPVGRTHWQLAGEDEDAVITEVSQLVVDCQRHRAGAQATELLRHQLAVLLLRLALLPGGDGQSAPAENAMFRKLRREVERSYRRTRRVEDYADRLGCSVRTLTRASLAATGRSAKQVLDDRVALQAMRLLAATDGSVAEIGRQLGFPEPTNFGRFFQREVGRTPGSFRAELGHPSRTRLPEQRPPTPTGPPPPPFPAPAGPPAPPFTGSARLAAAGPGPRPEGAGR